MGLDQHLTIWCVLCTAIFASANFIGQLEVSHLLRSFGTSYIGWFQRLFAFRVNKSGKLRPGFGRVFTVSAVLCIALFALQQYLLDWHFFTSTYNTYKNPAPNVTDTQHVASILFVIFAVFFLTIFSNFIFDRLSIIQSFWLGSKIKPGDSYVLIIYILADLAFSTVMAVICIAITLVITAISTNVAALMMSNVDLSDPIIFQAAMKLLLNLIIRWMERDINTIMSLDWGQYMMFIKLYPYVLPAFFTTIATSLWFIVYAFICLVLGSAGSVNATAEIISRTSTRIGTTSVVGAMGVMVFTIGYWTTYLVT